LEALDVLKKMEELGGRNRRQSVETLMREARRLGCRTEVGGGKDGGINFRYGSIRYAILDVNVQGQVKLYVQPHPNKTAPESLTDALNACILQNPGLEPKSAPIHSYGHLRESVEEVPHASLLAYLERAIDLIRDNYYRGTEDRS
jgi:hypothetical protein